MRFELNGIGSYLVKKQTKAVSTFIWTGILYIIFFYFGIKYGIDNLQYQLFMYILICLLAFITAIIIPITLNNKIKKVILSIEFEEDIIRIETKKGFDSFNNNNINFKKAIGHFTGFGKNHTNGFILQNNIKREYWLIETFFNDIEEIEKEINRLGLSK